MAERQRFGRIRLDDETGPLLRTVLDAYHSVMLKERSEGRVTNHEIGVMKRLRGELERTAKEEGWL